MAPARRKRERTQQGGECLGGTHIVPRTSTPKKGRQKATPKETAMAAMTQSVPGSTCCFRPTSQDVTHGDEIEIVKEVVHEDGERLEELESWYHETKRKRQRYWKELSSKRDAVNFGKKRESQGEEKGNKRRKLLVVAVGSGGKRSAVPKDTPGDKHLTEGIRGQKGSLRDANSDIDRLKAYYQSHLAPTIASSIRSSFDAYLKRTKAAFKTYTDKAEAALAKKQSEVDGLSAQNVVLLQAIERLGRHMKKSLKYSRGPLHREALGGACNCSNKELNVTF